MLRRDLYRVRSGDSGSLVVVDDISGRFARTSPAVWSWIERAYQGGCRSRLPTWLEDQAVSAGWTRRPPVQQRSWSLLSVRVPLFSIDPIARALVPLSGILFSRLAGLLWGAAGIITVIALFLHSDRLVGLFPSLPDYLAALSPTTLALLFVLTKASHELGHAVLCRRLGSRAGVLGIWFFCGIPCPFVDVSDVWRQPTAARRAAVMAAGMAIEVMIAIGAAWVVLLAESPATRLAAVHVVIVCSISTVLFNANPLMRYDGYFILSDWLDVGNLRGDARRAWRHLWRLPLPGVFRSGWRVVGLCFFHVASSVYRVFILTAIAAVVLAWANVAGCWRIGCVVVAIAAARLVWQRLPAAIDLVTGRRGWAGVPRLRRWLVLAAAAGVFALLFVPLPRYRHVSGVIRASRTQSVYLPRTGTLAQVHVAVGDRIQAGDVLAEVVDPDLRIRQAEVAGQQAVMRQRARVARLSSLRSDRTSSGSERDRRTNFRSSSEVDWRVYESAAASLAETSSELEKRSASLRVRAASAGLVLPGVPAGGTSDGGNKSIRPRGDRAEASPSTPAWAIDPFELTPAVGEPVDDRQAWCRIAESDELEAVLSVDVADHQLIRRGSVARIMLPHDRAFPLKSQVAEISPIQRPAPDAPAWEVEQRFYQVVCRIGSADESDLSRMVWLDGGTCTGVIHLPRRSVMQDILEALRGVLRWSSPDRTRSAPTPRATGDPSSTLARDAT